MPNKIYTKKRAHYEHIQAQTEKIIFLDKMLEKCRNDSLIAPGIRADFMDRGFNDVIDRVVKHCNETAQKLIAEQYEVETKILDNLYENPIKD